jgi:large subunit ribosomal protein L10
MSANLEAKKLIVEEIKQKISAAKSVAFVDYRGLTVDTDVKMRKTLRENGAEYKVYKNRLMLRALNDLGITGCEKFLEGTTAVAFSYDDEVSAPKILLNTIEEKKIMQFKFGVVDGKVLDADGVKALATLPPKETLLAMLLGLLKAPARNLACVLNAPISALARGLKAVSEK